MAWDFGRAPVCTRNSLKNREKNHEISPMCSIKRNMQHCTQRWCLNGSWAENWKLKLNETSATLKQVLYTENYLLKKSTEAIKCQKKREKYKHSWATLGVGMSCSAWNFMGFFFFTFLGCFSFIFQWASAQKLNVISIFQNPLTSLLMADSLWTPVFPGFYSETVNQT